MASQNSFQKTNYTLKGKGFTFTNELRAKQIGMPLLEFFCIYSGGESIDVGSMEQLEHFLKSWDVSYSKIQLGTDTLITLIGEFRRTVTFQFDYQRKMSVRYLSFNDFKRNMKASIDNEKKAIRERMAAQIAEKDEKMTKVMELLTV